MGLFGGPFHDDRPTGPGHFNTDAVTLLVGSRPFGGSDAAGQRQGHEGRRRRPSVSPSVTDPAADQIGVELVVQSDAGDGYAQFPTGGHDAGLELTRKVTATSVLGVG